MEQITSKNLEQTAVSQNNVSQSVSGKCANLVEYCWNGEEIRRVPPTCEFEKCQAVPPLAEWETYSDPKFGYKISYPFDNFSPYVNEYEKSEKVYFLHYCLNVEVFPEATVRADNPQQYDPLFIFSPEVSALEVGKTARFEVHEQEESIEYVYTRLADKTVNGNMWKAYRWSNNWEMYAEVTKYLAKDSHNYYVFSVSEGGRCPKGIPTTVVETFTFPQ